MESGKKNSTDMNDEVVKETKEIEATKENSPIMEKSVSLKKKIVWSFWAVWRTGSDASSGRDLRRKKKEERFTKDKNAKIHDNGVQHLDTSPTKFDQKGQ